MHLALAIDQVVWKFQLLKVQVTLAMYAVLVLGFAVVHA
jgi:hypothetical protein